MICFSTGTHTYGMIDSYVQKVKVKASMASYIHITMWLLLWSYFLSMVHPEVKKLPAFHGSCLVHDLWLKSAPTFPCSWFLPSMVVLYWFFEEQGCSLASLVCKKVKWILDVYYGILWWR